MPVVRPHIVVVVAAAAEVVVQAEVLIPKSNKSKSQQLTLILRVPMPSLTNLQLLHLRKLASPQRALQKAALRRPRRTRLYLPIILKRLSLTLCHLRRLSVLLVVLMHLVVEVVDEEGEVWVQVEAWAETGGKRRGRRTWLRLVSLVV